MLLTPSFQAQTASKASANSLPLVSVTMLLLLALLSTAYFFNKYRVLKKEKQQADLQVQALKTDLYVNRALLNPHFIFNSLSALQHFILNHDHVSANNHLVKFSKLIRKMLESNVAPITSMELELAMIKSYMQFKDISIKEPIKDFVTVDPSISLPDVYIPVMMVQPFIENAIWHGLLKKEGEKRLSIAYTLQGSYILCTIDDNGIGRKKADEKALEKKLPSTTFTRQRLELLNSMHGLNCSLTIEDKPLDGGTTVKILLPILKKP